MKPRVLRSWLAQLAAVNVDRRDVTPPRNWLCRDGFHDIGPGGACVDCEVER